MSMKIFIVSIIIFIGLLLAYNRNSLLPFTENVLTDGMKITAHTPIETLTIEGTKGTKRVFRGKGWSTVANLTPRPTRWYGSLGLYDPADSYVQDERLLVNEGRQFFSNENEVLRYICHFKKLADSAYDKAHNGTVVYNNSGLIIVYRITSLKRGGFVRYIDIWQVYINGKKPTSLKGADDHTIEISGDTIPDTAKPHTAEIGEPRQSCTEKEFKDSQYYQELIK